MKNFNINKKIIKMLIGVLKYDAYLKYYFLSTFKI